MTWCENLIRFVRFISKAIFHFLSKHKRNIGKKQQTYYLLLLAKSNNLFQQFVAVITSKEQQQRKKKTFCICHKKYINKIGNMQIFKQYFLLLLLLVDAVNTTESGRENERKKFVMRKIQKLIRMNYGHFNELYHVNFQTYWWKKTNKNGKKRYQSNVLKNIIWHICISTRWIR